MALSSNLKINSRHQPPPSARLNLQARPNPGQIFRSNRSALTTGMAQATYPGQTAKNLLLKEIYL
ncbi:MAG: hypothetical protein HC824_08570 [Synechococcales cyanobacterium RM1_1_8]|nr:hypothetical protein [Synechococcales cyanobacterium RM1_1_8]